MAERLATLEKEFRQYPELPLFARLADCYLQRGLAVKALEVCRAGCSRFPDYSPGHAVLSRCHEALEDLEAARAALGRALRLDPDNPAGLKRLATLQEGLGDHEAARAALIQAGRLDPLDAQVAERLDRFAYTERLEAVGVRSQPYDELPRPHEVSAAARQRARQLVVGL